MWGPGRCGDLRKVAELGTACRTALPTTGAFLPSGLPGAEVGCWGRPAERPGMPPPLVKEGIWEAEVQLPTLS